VLASRALDSSSSTFRRRRPWPDRCCAGATAPTRRSWASQAPRGWRSGSPPWASISCRLLSRHLRSARTGPRSHQDAVVVPEKLGLAAAVRRRTKRRQQLLPPAMGVASCTNWNRHSTEVGAQVCAASCYLCRSDWRGLASPRHCYPLHQVCGRCGDGIWVLAQRVALWRDGWRWWSTRCYDFLFFWIDWKVHACVLAHCGGANDWGKWTVAVCPVALVPLLSPYPFSLVLRYCWVCALFSHPETCMYSVVKSHLRYRPNF